MTAYDLSTIGKTVKLVVWDLDETFWSGTLSEGGITPRPGNIALVRELAERGIVSSICSKNDFAQAKAQLEALGVWEYFVFPHIDWTPKGQAIAGMIADMGLRDENVLFLDDNPMNLEEAKFFNERIMCVDGRLDLAPLRDLPQLAGKDDRGLSRLKQYKVGEAKHRERTQTALSNEDFLRQSDIRLRHVYDIEAHWERVLELINRTNQLNFTKKRVETPEAEAELREMLRMPGAHAALIEVADRFGDYGMVGFYLMVKRSSGARLEHFAFSCRTLNMGIEQYVYDRLERPALTIAQPVANGLDRFEAVDWVREDAGGAAGAEAPDRRLCLVGGCDLLQMSFYCGSNRDEFVNTVRNGMVVRYDDVGFILNDRSDPSIERFRSRLEMWSHAEMLAFDGALAEADVVILSLYQSAAGQNFFTFGGTEFGGRHLVHVPAQAMRTVLAGPNAAWFAKNFYYRRYGLEEKLALVRQACERVLSQVRPGTPVVLIAASEAGERSERSLPVRQAFNALCREVATSWESAVLADPAEIMAPEDVVDADHFTRIGYFKLAQFINETAAAFSGSDQTVKDVRDAQDLQQAV
ncbi:hypothetical protein [Tropicimonas sediminicola]|uniref:FkbH-like domain-containing protein n=1 Tax=Tropicimonas sediminicola TaxID=1031541 RepID=A0A239D8R7_9RHOB|nr:hypothetical protein [Tropicimonas sediminicola]SNS28687.1 FkbH-like domain-containing protein [Tropicimonas sediminicola]